MSQEWEVFLMLIDKMSIMKASLKFIMINKGGEI